MSSLAQRRRVRGRPARRCGPSTVTGASGLPRVLTVAAIPSHLQAAPPRTTPAPLPCIQASNRCPTAFGIAASGTLIGPPARRRAQLPLSTSPVLLRRPGRRWTSCGAPSAAAAASVTLRLRCPPLRPRCPPSLSPGPPRRSQLPPSTPPDLLRRPGRRWTSCGAPAAAAAASKRLRCLPSRPRRRRPPSRSPPRQTQVPLLLLEPAPSAAVPRHGHLGPRHGHLGLGVSHTRARVCVSHIRARARVCARECVYACPCLGLLCPGVAACVCVRACACVRACVLVRAFCVRACSCVCACSCVRVRACVRACVRAYLPLWASWSWRCGAAAIYR